MSGSIDHSSNHPSEVESENTAFNPNDFNPDGEELAFLKSQTGIDNEDALRDHCFKVQASAYEVFPYNCIRRFNFIRLKIARLPAYPHLLELGKERKGAILLDIGCCFGNDVRKAVLDGYPVDNIIASDIQPEFWQLGHEFFRSAQGTFPVPFIPGDAFDQDFLKRSSPVYDTPETPIPDLQALTTLTPLLGHVSAIHASAFFHLFSEEEQYKLAQSLAGLLSPKPGSMIFGAHSGREVPGLRTEFAPKEPGKYMFCHSPESWAELWDGKIFRKNSVKVEVLLISSDRAAKASHVVPQMHWSVTRL
ncbi:hypothetical protein CERSUDRAFT_115828 [Gelatoporia subvermispora B]|uniref:Methyltransferase domain-containing protein n=1 Tax=Ceriporiopsis subvermispora (strain B) TaxID=914234 RepID=M2RAY3_CERS8|nr:hypothetical protein CERSUDRAFT_115828 [Gelatoporia subvermispora B]